MIVWQGSAVTLSLYKCMEDFCMWPRCCYHWSTNAWSPFLTINSEIKWRKEGHNSVGVRANHGGIAGGMTGLPCQQPEPPLPLCFLSLSQKLPHNNQDFAKDWLKVLTCRPLSELLRNPDRASGPSQLGPVKSIRSKISLPQLLAASWLPGI